jgi:peptide/nickel transport system substrate-binding protein/glutathione transport system substrate-binding protein
VDAAKRKGMLVEAAKLAWDEAPYLWLYGENVVVAKRKELKGVEIQPVIFTILRNARP